MTRKLEGINAWFGDAAKTIIKFRWLIIATVLVLNGLGFMGMNRIKQDNSNESWMLEDDPLVVARDKFEEIFGNNDYVIVLIEADDVFTPEILTMMRELGDALEREVPYADKVTSLAHLEFTLATEEGLEVGDLVPEIIPTDPAALDAIRQLALTKKHLVDRIFSRDGTKAAVFLRLRTYPVDEHTTDTDCRSLVAEAVYKILQSDKFGHFTLLASGAPVSNYDGRKWIPKEGARLFGIALLVMLIILFILFRSWVGLIAPIVTALSVTCWIFGAMGWLGIEVQSLVMIIPILLILVVSIGYSVHVISFFKQRFTATGNRHGAVRFAVKQTGWPILFTVLTTAVGFLSFFVVPIGAIRWMGLTSASLALTAYPLVMLLTPALLSFGKNRKPNPEYAKKGGGWAEIVLVKLGEWVRGHGIGIMAVFGVVILAFGFYLTKVEVNTDIIKTMGLKVPYLARMYHVANSIGSLYSYDATFDFGEEGKAKDPEALAKLDTLSAEIGKFSTIKRTSSILDIIKDLNQTMHGDDPAYYRIPQDPELVSQLLLLYEMSGGTEAETWVDYEYTMLRLTCELKDYSARECEELLDYMNKRAGELFPDATLGMIGTVIQYAKMINHLMDGQIKSVLTALVAITLIMMLVFGSAKLGLIGMIPNIAPVILVVGAMGMLDDPLNYVTMMIAPMIIGIAVDDTIHFISHFKLAFYRTGNYAEANRDTFRSVGKPIFMTSLIIVLGFLVFTTSVAKTYQCHGFYTIVAVIAALAADYFVTPTLIMRMKAFGKEK